MTLPTEFIQQPKAVSSYEFSDLASGTAYQKFYLTNTISGSVLIDNATYGDRVWTKAQEIGGTGIILTNTFGVLFKKPQDIKGELVVSIPTARFQGGGSTTTDQLIITAQKLSGGTTTNIMSVSSEILSTTTGSVTEFRDTIGLTMPLTHYKIDDELKIRVEYKVVTASGNNHTVWFAQDPMNRKTDTKDNATPTARTFVIDTISEAYVPFRIDI